MSSSMTCSHSTFHCTTSWDYANYEASGAEISGDSIRRFLGLYGFSKLGLSEIQRFRAWLASSEQVQYFELGVQIRALLCFRDVDKSTVQLFVESVRDSYGAPAWQLWPRSLLGDIPETLATKILK